MKVKITEDKRFLQVVETTELEEEQLKYSFRRRISNWRWHPLVKRKVWDGYISFIDKYNRIPIGLWQKLIFECKKYDFQLEIINSDWLINENIDFDKFKAWCEYFFKNKKDLKPRDYQIESVYKMIKYYRSRSELATSAGKTFMMFMVYAYLKEIGELDRMLIVVPNTQLVLQTHNDFLEYIKDTPIEDHPPTIQMLYGATDKNKTSSDILLGTMQSLVKRDVDFFEDINVTCIDECHHTNAKTIKDIIIKNYDSKYRFGISGTLKNDDSAESYTLDAYLGPTIHKISADYLIKHGFATAIKVKSIKLDYIDDSIKEKLYYLRKSKNTDGAKVLEIERKLLNENKKRFNYITHLISKVTKNTLVLFLDIKYEYGKRIYNRLREITTDKNIYYVDGSTDIDLRDRYKSEMEEGENKIMIASFGTFAQGISIKNIHHLFLAEAYKSDRLIRQSAGRGMRLLDGKEQFIIWDFIDDFSWRGVKEKDWKKDNYLLKHGNERLKIYKEQKFPVIKFKLQI